MNFKYILFAALLMLPDLSFADAQNDTKSFYEKVNKHKTEIMVGGALLGAFGGLLYWSCSRNIQSEVKNHRKNFRELFETYTQYFNAVNPEILSQRVERNHVATQQFVATLNRDLAIVKGICRQLRAITIDYEGQDFGASKLLSEVQKLEASMNELSAFMFSFRGHFALEETYREMVDQYRDEEHIPTSINLLTQEQVLNLANSKLDFIRDPHPLVRYADHIMVGMQKLNRGINLHDVSKNSITSPRYKWALNLRHILTVIKDALAIAPQFTEQKRQYVAFQQQNALIAAEQAKASAEHRKARAAEKEANAKHELARAARQQADVAQQQLELERQKFIDAKRRQVLEQQPTHQAIQIGFQPVGASNDR